MHQKYLTTSLLIISVIYSPQVLSKEFDWSKWQDIISKHSTSGNAHHISTRLFDYQKLIDDKRIKLINQSLIQYDDNQLTENQKKTFYINAYNYYAVLIVLNNWPVDSIRDIGNIFFQVWDKDVGYINGQAITLNQIEHNILRPMGDPRIHFAIVCASMSCPDINPKIYISKRLDKQLDQQSKLFLQNQDKGLILSNNDIKISAIFKWFQADFESRGGVVNFIRHYYPIPDTINNIEYLPYNWRLNASLSVSN